MTRISRKFAQLKSEKRKGLVTFVTAGDPDHDASRAVLAALPGWGADVIELGMPFSDPMADGPAIQESSRRALKGGMTLEKTLAMAGAFRAKDAQTPLVLMGYFNPIYSYGTDRFAAKAAENGVDGLIIVDLPPEEDDELNGPARKVGVDVIRLVTPTTTAARLDRILDGASGFIYCVSIAGVTGVASANAVRIEPVVNMIREKSDLPVAVGFGINTPADASAMARIADAVVVGSALVRTVAAGGDSGAQVRALKAALD